MTQAATGLPCPSILICRKLSSWSMPPPRVPWEVSPLHPSDILMAQGGGEPGLIAEHPRASRRHVLHSMDGKACWACTTAQQQPQQCLRSGRLIPGVLRPLPSPHHLIAQLIHSLNYSSISQTYAWVSDTLLGSEERKKDPPIPYIGDYRRGVRGRHRGGGIWV